MKEVGEQMIIHDIPYVPQVEPVRPPGDRSKSFEEELRKHMREQVNSNRGFKRVQKELRGCLR